MVDAPKPFWYLGGVALLIVAGAVAYRILIPSPGENLQLGAGDFSVTLNAVQQNVDAAQATIQTLTRQAQAQRTEIVALERRIAEQQTQNQQLLAEIQKLPQAPVALKNALVAFQEKASQPLPPVTQVDTKLIAAAQQHLDLAKHAAYKLSTMKK